MTGFDLSRNHPALTVALYADAVRARAAGRSDEAWAMEEAGFREPHYTAIDFCCRGLAKLRHGDWSGWTDYEFRFNDPRHMAQHGRPFMRDHEPWSRFAPVAARGDLFTFERPDWAEELSGLTILIGQEGGAGDMIMLSRFVPWLAARAKKVYWLVPTDLHRLMHYAYGREWDESTADLVDSDKLRVIAQETLPPFDRYVMMFSLPAIVGEMLPPGEAFEPVAHLGQRVGSTGLCFAGSIEYGNNAARSMNAQDVRALLEQLYVRGRAAYPLLSYQRGPSAALWPGDETSSRTTGDWYDTAQSLASECKRIITVDTGLAHLAAAMNIPTHIMLSEQDWRWNARPGQYGVTSNWYPSAKLYVQPQPGAWGPVIEHVVEAIR